MTDVEFKPHRKAIERWLGDDNPEIIHFWKDQNLDYEVSYYVVLIKYTDHVMVNCLRVFGGGENSSANISSDGWHRLST